MSHPEHAHERDASALHGYCRRSAQDFPRLKIAVDQLMSLTGIEANEGRPLFLYGSFVRAQLVGDGAFGDIDMAVATIEDRDRLRPMIRDPFLWRDPHSLATRYTMCEVNPAPFPSVDALLVWLNEFTVSGFYYSLADDSLWVPPHGFEHLALRLLVRPRSESILPLRTWPLKIFCRTFKYLTRGYRIQQKDLLLVYRAYRGRPWWRRLAERILINRRYGGRMINE